MITFTCCHLYFRLSKLQRIKYCKLWIAYDQLPLAKPLGADTKYTYFFKLVTKNYFYNLGFSTVSFLIWEGCSPFDQNSKKWLKLITQDYISYWGQQKIFPNKILHKMARPEYRERALLAEVFWWLLYMYFSLQCAVAIDSLWAAVWFWPFYSPHIY